MILLQLFLTFMKIGAFGVGGGYAAMALIRQQAVDIRGWLTMTQFSDVIAISEMTPGPITLNAATFVGIQVAGLPGAIVATLGCILPSCVIVLVLAYVYYRYRGLDAVSGVLAGLRPAVIAMIAAAGLSVLTLALYGERGLPVPLTAPDWTSVGIFLAAFLALRKWKIGPIAVMAGAGALGLILYSLI